MLSGVGCSDDKKGQTSKSVSALASHTPSDLKFAVVAPSIDKFQSSYSGQWKQVKKTFEGASGDDTTLVNPDSMSDFVGNLKKVDMKTSGIDTTGPLMATVHDDTGILVARAKKKKDFNAFVPKIFEGKTGQKKVDGSTLHYVEPKGDRDVPVGWIYAGSHVALGAPSSGDVSELSKGLTSFLKKRKDKESLKGQTGFAQFQKALVGPKSIATYVSTSQNEEFVEGLRSGACGKYGSYKSSLCDAIVGQLQGTGFSMRMPGEDHVQFRGWMGWKSKGTKWMKETMQSTQTVDWKRFATKDTTLAMRMSLNPKKFWDDFTSSLRDRAKKSLDRSLEQMKKASGGEFDFEKDLVGGLSGQGGFFFYDVGKMQGRPSMAAMTSTYLFALQTKSGTKPESLVKSVKPLFGKQMPGDIKIEKLKTSSGKTISGVKVAELSGPMAKAQIPKVYLTDQLLVFASGAFKAKEMGNLLKGKGDVGPIAKADGVEIGKPFSQKKHLNAIYLNGDRLVGQLKDEMKGLPSSVWKYVEPIHEIGMDIAVDERGTFATFETRTDFQKALETFQSLTEPRDRAGAGGSGSKQLERVGEELDLNLDALKGQKIKQEKKMDNLNNNLQKMDNLDLGK